MLRQEWAFFTLGGGRSAPNISVYGDTGEVPLTIKGFTLMVNFWHHLTNLPDTNLAKLALKENIAIRTNWLKNDQIIKLVKDAGYKVTSIKRLDNLKPNRYNKP